MIKTIYKNWEDDVAYGGNKYLFKVCVNNKGFLNVYVLNDTITNNKEKDFKMTHIGGKLLQRIYNLDIINKHNIYNMNDINLIDNIFSYKHRFDISNLHLIEKEYNIDTNFSLKDSILNSSNKRDKLNMLFGESILNDVISANDTNNSQFCIYSNDTSKWNMDISCIRKNGLSSLIDVKVDIHELQDDTIHITKLYC
jgi:hypothetical protein